MNHKTGLIGLLLAVLVLMAACTPPATTTPTTATDEPTEEPRAIVVGDISDDPGEVIEGMQPFADYLADHLSEFGITHGEVVVAQDADSMAQMLENGEVDLIFDSVYPAMLMSDASGAQPILRRWRRGVEEYNSIIFASRESGITDVADLPGNIIAFDNQFSTSGFVLPAVYLSEEGLSLTGLGSYDETAPDDEIGFVFSFDDENTLQWVLNGLVAAGVTDNERFASFPQDARDELVILAESEFVPRQVVLVRPNMDEDYLAAITDLLTTMHEDEDGMAALEQFDGTAKFDEFPEGIDAMFERMREYKEIIDGIELP